MMGGRGVGNQIARFRTIDTYPVGVYVCVQVTSRRIMILVSKIGNTSVQYAHE